MSWFCALIPEVDEAVEVELKMDDWGCTLASGPDSGNLLDNLDAAPGIGKGQGVAGAVGATVAVAVTEVTGAASAPGVGKRSITDPLVCTVFVAKILTKTR